MREGLMQCLGLENNDGTNSGYSHEATLTRWQQVKLSAVRLNCLSRSYVVLPGEAIFYERVVYLGLLQALKDYGVSLSSELRCSIQAFAVVLAFSKFLADMLSENPIAIADAYMFLRAHRGEMAPIRRLLRYGAFSASTLSLFFVYPLMHIMPVLPLAELDALNQVSRMKDIVTYSLFSLLVLHGMTYGWFLDRKNTEGAIEQLVRYMLEGISHIRSLPSHIHVLFEAMFNSFVFSVLSSTFGIFLMKEVLKRIFNIEDIDLGQKIAIGGVGGVISLFSLLKTLPPNIYHQLFLKRTLNNRNDIEVSLWSIFKIYMLSTLRGFGIAGIMGGLLHSHVTQNPFITIPVSGVLAIPLYSHTFSAKYQQAKYDQYQANCMRSESHISYAPSSSLSNEPFDAIDNEKAFYELMQDHRPGPVFRTVAYGLSILPYVLLMMTAYIFLRVTNTLFNFGLGEVGLAAMLVLIGENRLGSIPKTQEMICTRRAYYAAAKHMEDHLSSGHCFFRKVAAAVFASPVQYPEREIQQAGRINSRKS